MQEILTTFPGQGPMFQSIGLAKRNAQPAESSAGALPPQGAASESIRGNAALEAPPMQGA